jgi:hypothetical protein
MPEEKQKISVLLDKNDGYSFCKGGRRVITLGFRITTQKG